MLGAAFAGCDAPDNVCAVLDHLLGVKCTFAAGETLNEQARLFIDEDAHRGPPARFTTFCAPSFMSLAMVKFKPLSRRICWPTSTLVPSIRTTTGTFKCKSLAAATTPVARTSQRRIPPKILMNTAFTAGSFIRIRKAFLTWSEEAPPDVKKVGRRAAGVFDDVHSGHGEARAVYHAGYAAVELDVVEAVLGGLDFEGVFFIEISQLAELFVAEQRVVVKSHLGVEGHQLAVPGQNAGIDFEQRSVGVREGAIEGLQKGRSVVDDFEGQAESESNLAGLIRFEADRRMDGLAQNRGGIFLGEFLDFHAARRTGHENDAA